MSENSITIESLLKTLAMMCPLHGDGWKEYPVYLVMKNGYVASIKEFEMELVPKDVDSELRSLLPHTEFFDGGLFLKEL